MIDIIIGVLRKQGIYSKTFFKNYENKFKDVVMNNKIVLKIWFIVSKKGRFYRYTRVYEEI